MPLSTSSPIIRQAAVRIVRVGVAGERFIIAEVVLRPTCLEIWVRRENIEGITDGGWYIRSQESARRAVFLGELGKLVVVVIQKLRTLVRSRTLFCDGIMQNHRISPYLQLLSNIAVSPEGHIAGSFRRKSYFPFRPFYLIA